MKKNYITLFYFCLVVLTAAQILGTVFQGSLQVHQGYRIAQLQSAQSELQKQAELLSSETQLNQSIESIERSRLTDNFQPVTGVLAISEHDSKVADSSL